MSAEDPPSPAQLQAERVDIYVRVLVERLRYLKPMCLRWNQYRGQVAGEPAAPTTEEMELVAEKFTKSGWIAYYVKAEEFGHDNHVIIKEFS